MTGPRPRATSRREFLCATGGLAAAPLAVVAAPHVAGSDVLRLGLIGCGGRGTGAANEAVRADPNVRLVAMGDVFQDHLESKLAHLQKLEGVADRVDVPPDRRFVGFDAYEHVLDQCDVAILAAPPHFRPAHFARAVAKGVHTFVEKPVAVDPAGVRSIRASCEVARQKKLSVVSGLCYRYHHGRRELMRRIHDGQIGAVVALHVSYITNGLWKHPRQEGWSDMEFQLRNWLYYTWLAGDHITEQHIHSLDVAAWAMGGVYPQSVVSLGGRQSRTDELFGHVFDHFASIYEWENGVKCFSFCRQQDGCYREVKDYVVGTKGRADVFAHEITGETPWSLGRVRGHDMYQNEHDELFRSIRKGEPIDDGEFMWKSTLMAVMGRIAGYTGRKVTWQEALESPEDLSPAKYEWGDLPTPPVARPGAPS